MGSYIVSLPGLYPSQPAAYSPKRFLSFDPSALQANRVTDKLTHISDRIYCCRR